jgi:DNA-binding XRE family transcriptional regulator
MEERMKRQKKVRLEAAGWKIGSAKEFLGLTDAEAAIVELKLELAKALREQRARRKMTQEQAGRMLGSSQSRVAKMEAGDPSVSIDLLVRALFGLGGSRQDLARRLAAPTKWRAA